MCGYTTTSRSGNTGTAVGMTAVSVTELSVLTRCPYRLIADECADEVKTVQKIPEAPHACQRPHPQIIAASSDMRTTTRKTGFTLQRKMIDSAARNRRDEAIPCAGDKQTPLRRRKV